MKEWERLPHLLPLHPLNNIEIVGGRGVHLFSKDGKRYMDFEAGIWCVNLGHNHEAIGKAAQEQLEKIVHLGPRFTASLANQTAETLANLLGKENRLAVFLNSGSEAVELALKIACAITGRNSFITLKGTYLGAYGTAGVLSQEENQLSFSFCHSCTEAFCLQECQHLQSFELSHVAAFVFEPVITSRGVFVPPDKLVTKIARLVKESGGLLLVDEVTTGLGRLGKWAGYQHYNLPEPDIIIFGKALGNGFPVSAVLTRALHRENLQSFYHVQSHQNDPFGCAVALQVLRILQEEKLILKAAEIGVVLKKRLEELITEMEMPFEIRGKGMLVGMNPLKSVYSQPEKISTFIYKEMLKHHIILGLGSNGVIRLLPPLIITEDEINTMCHKLKHVLYKADNLYK